MSEYFPRVLTLLRREKGVSQRLAASQLGISQALLSHYEKGAREPGLAFVSRACDYYGVSADFLLGRSMLRDGAGPGAEDLHDASADKDNRLRGGVSAVLHKKLLINSISLLFELLGQLRRKELIEAAAGHLGGAVYTLFRHLYDRCGEHAELLFSTPPECASLLAGADRALLEARLSALLRDLPRGVTLPVFSRDQLARDYPLLYQSLFMLLQQVTNRLSSLAY
ncbi:MAG: helix-turn-helix domain-containing protein [Oscillospiraceae bacterium]|jgi:transcriptional regulator with XRE-family HTH domain|nr:helix-turn-helix domain-containing protein [Oscillospiraceae bacterium]